MFKLTRQRRLDSIRCALRSPLQEQRVLAMQQLRRWAREDPAIRVEALPIFLHAVAFEPDRWTSIAAADGVGIVAGPEAGRTVWLSLIHRADAATVAAAAGAVSNVTLAAHLIDLLERRSEPSIRRAVIRWLGRTRVPGALPTILSVVDLPELRADAVQALTDLGDPRAIPALEALLEDRADALQEDNHGPMLRVCDLASAGIDRLRQLAQ